MGISTVARTKTYCPRPILERTIMSYLGTTMIVLFRNYHATRLSSRI